MRQAPLRSVILSRTGEDVRLCQACDGCENLLAPGMDLTFGELFRAAARDEATVLRCASLWCCEPLLDRPLACQGGIDIPAVVRALREEARLRGSWAASPPEWIL